MDEVDLTEMCVCIISLLVLSSLNSFWFSFLNFSYILFTWSHYFILFYYFFSVVGLKKKVSNYLLFRNIEKSSSTTSWQLRHENCLHLLARQQQIQTLLTFFFLLLQKLQVLKKPQRVKDSWSEIMHAFLRKSPWEMHWHDLHDNFLM
jgi:hypothetical protein